MRVKCVANKGSNLPEDILGRSSGFHKETEFPLVVGKDYVVYGITLHLGYVWYYLEDEHYAYYPVWNPSPLFEATDGKISKYWRYGYHADRNRDEVNVIFAFKEWVDDPYYYDKLTDGEEEAVMVFRHYKKLMDVEFPDWSISKTASDLGDGWVMCPDCQEAWQTASFDGMLRCPKCSVLLHNPLYKDPGNVPLQLG